MFSPQISQKDKVARRAIHSYLKLKCITFLFQFCNYNIYIIMYNIYLYVLYYDIYYVYKIGMQMLFQDFKPSELTPGLRPARGLRANAVPPFPPPAHLLTLFSTAFSIPNCLMPLLRRRRGVLPKICLPFGAHILVGKAITWKSITHTLLKSLIWSYFFMFSQICPIPRIFMIVFFKPPKHEPITIRLLPSVFGAGTRVHRAS